MKKVSEETLYSIWVQGFESGRHSDTPTEGAMKEEFNELMDEMFPSPRDLKRDATTNA